MGLEGRHAADLSRRREKAVLASRLETFITSDIDSLLWKLSDEQFKSVKCKMALLQEALDKENIRRALKPA